MDMSFANQALGAAYLSRKADSLEKNVYAVPQDIDDEVAALKLRAMGVNIDVLTEEQAEYLASWHIGT
jgi:adenosylhomocysteinase